MYKVVIVEDEILLQKALQKIISKYSDFEVCFTAPNGKIAFEYLCDHRADICITDIRMPIMDGLELVKKVKEAGINIQLIVISGYDDFEYAKHMLKYGAFSYLLKPLVADELACTLQEVVKHIAKEEMQRNMLKSYKFDILQREGYVHFTDELPNSLLYSHKIFACCIDFKCVPSKEIVIKAQFELEDLLYPCACFILDAYLYTIISLDQTDRERIEVVTEIQTYFIKEGIQTRLGIGLPVSSMMSIYKSMKQARHALRFYEMLPYDEFVDYERISILKVPSIPYPFIIEKKLIDSVYQCDPEKINKSIGELESIFLNQNIDIVYQLLTELIINCKHEFSNYMLENCEWDEHLFNVQHRYPWKKILYDIHQTFLGIQIQLNEHQKAKNMSLILTVKKYIEEHLKEPITLEEVAGVCFLSKSHFCKLFKEETGKTFKAYLNGIRIEHAKTLIRRSNLKNYEICSEIGLEDVSYFNELFKKETGMTPSEFREL